MSRLTGQTVAPLIPEDGSIVASQLSANCVNSSNIQDGTVTLAKLAQIPNLSLLGLGTGVTASPVAVTLGSGLSFTGDVLNTTAAALPNFTNLSVLRGDGTNAPVADSRISFPTNGTVELSPTGAGIVNLRGNVKRPNMAMVSATVSTALSLSAGVATTIAFNSPGASVIGTGISFNSTTTITIARAGIYQVIFNASVRSATANAQGIHTLLLAGGAAALPLPAKAFRLGAANRAVETSWVFVLNLTSPGDLSIRTTMDFVSSLVANTTAFPAPSTSDILIMEIA